MAKSALITGAASGIGRETARLFSARGWRVGLVDRDEAGSVALARELGPEALGLACDVTRPGAFAECLERFTATTEGRLDLLVNNAGILHTGAFASLPIGAHRELIDVNVSGFTEVLYAAFGALKAARGAVVNLASASAEYGTPEFATYSATKFYVRGLTEALDLEWRRHGIRVSYVMPAFVATPMIQGRHTASMERLGKALDPADVARVIWRATHSRRLAWRVGWQFRAIRLLMAAMPLTVKRTVVGWVTGYGGRA